MLEIEIRSFITKKEFDNLKKFFNKNAKLIKNDFQETYYFDCPQDLRIQKNRYYSKIWLKSGKIHDEKREELEIKFDKEDFSNLLDLFTTLKYKVKIKWLRKRSEYRWRGIKVCLDNTKGYGLILELEGKNIKKLKKMMSELNIELTPRKEFEEKFKYYKKNWRKLI